MLTQGAQGVDEHGVLPEELKTRAPRAVRSAVGETFLVLALVAIVIAVLFVRGWRPTATNADLARQEIGIPAMPASPAIESTYGVRFLGVDVTAGGGMIQVRYQVLDSDKTQAIHDEVSTPHVITADGTDYGLPGMPGHTHIGPVKKAGTTDFVLLANSGGGVTPGSTVTIKMGDLALANVPVS